MSSFRFSVPRSDRVRLVAASVCYVVIAVLSSVPGDLRPQMPFSDKLEHAFAYLALGALTVVAAPRVFGRWVLAIVVAYATLLEAVQVFVPGRDASFLDLAASSAGALSGVILGHLIRSPLMSR